MKKPHSNNSRRPVTQHQYPIGKQHRLQKSTPKKFRSNFLEWSKSNILVLPSNGSNSNQQHQNQQSRQQPHYHNRSKSPSCEVFYNQRSLNLSKKRDNCDKQNQSGCSQNKNGIGGRLQSSQSQNLLFLPSSVNNCNNKENVRPNRPNTAMVTGTGGSCGNNLELKIQAATSSKLSKERPSSSSMVNKNNKKKIKVTGATAGTAIGSQQKHYRSVSAKSHSNNVDGGGSGSGLLLMGMGSKNYKSAKSIEKSYCSKNRQQTKYSNQRKLELTSSLKKNHYNNSCDSISEYQRRKQREQQQKQLAKPKLKSKSIVKQRQRSTSQHFHNSSQNQNQNQNQNSISKLHPSSSTKQSKPTTTPSTNPSSQNTPYSTLKYSYRTKQGIQINNPNKTNQDSLLIKTQLNQQKNMYMFAVADGHGLFGHCVSQYLVKNLTKVIEGEIKEKGVLMKKKGKNRENGQSVDKDAEKNCIQKNPKGKEQQSPPPPQSSVQPALQTSLLLPQILPRAYTKLQKGLTGPNCQINASCSGSTLVNVIIDKNYITCSNVGDSRAILSRQIDRKNWQVIYLSQDHKPELEGEKKRILQNGGRIHAFKDERGCPIGPQRVWLQNQSKFCCDAIDIQGLAMSRSFGDNVSKTVGVTHIPEIIRVRTDPRDRFILLASDGIWEFITNQEVLQLLVPYWKDDKIEEACDALMKLAYDRWTVEDKSIVDDITLVLVFFNNGGNGGGEGYGKVENNKGRQ